MEKEYEAKCVDCDAFSLASSLEKINLDDENVDLIQAMKKMKEAIIFILYNNKQPIKRLIIHKSK